MERYLSRKKNKERNCHNCHPLTESIQKNAFKAFVYQQYFVFLHP